MNRWFRGAGVMPLGLCGAGALLCVLEACSSSAETQSRLEHDPEDTKPEAGTDGDLSSDGADDAESPSQPYDLSVQCATKPCVTQIAARGGAHACTLLEDRSVRCWGANDSGQLGIGRADGGPTSIQEGAPRRVLDIAGAVAVAAAGAGGTGTTCVILESGEVACFGSNASGQLGGGSRSPEPEPLVVPNVRSTAIALTATFALAVDADARLWSWGENGRLQLAQSLTAADAGPPEVLGAGLADRVTRAVRGAAGTLKNGFALTDNGEVLSWGAGTTDQLGRVSSLVDEPAPKAVAVSGVSKVTGGAAHACALGRGSVHCWGKNARGQLGTTRKADELAPARVVLPADVVPVDVAAGADNTCVITAKGDLYCWGANESGQLGTHPSVDQASPVQIRGLEGETVAVAIMDSAICALLREGSVMCWGQNARGQLGRGARDPDIHLDPETVVFE